MPEVDIKTSTPAPVNIRRLVCLDMIDVCDRPGRLIGVLTSITNPVDISDRCNRYLGQLCFDGVPIDPRQIRNLTFATDSVNVSGSTVNIVNAPTSPINDYNIAMGLGSESSSIHTYVVTGNFRLSSIQASASGAMKIEVKAGNSELETTRMVAFTSPSNLIAQLKFHEELSLIAGQRIQIIRTNRENQPMDVFSTILGFNI